MRLLDLLFPPREDESVLRAFSDDEFLAFVEPQLVTVPHPQATTLFSFQNPAVRSVIHEAKYHGSERAFGLLSRALSEYLRDAEEGFGRPILIPVPLGSARRKERLFNQTEEIVRRAAAELGMTTDMECLARTRDTVSQVSLPRDKRIENMRGAFRAARPIDPDRTYIIIDDVVTTGATLQACIDALTEAGAQHVLPLALAH